MPRSNNTLIVLAAHGEHERPMKTTTISALGSNIIVQTLINRYGVNGLTADPIAVMWAVDHTLKMHSVPAVKAALKRLNNKRTAMGKMPAYPHFGHPLF